jgi:hypothetical protein
MKVENSISETAFVLLISGLKSQIKYEYGLNTAFKEISQENSIFELAPILSRTIFDMLALSFTEAGMGIIFDYLYNDKKTCQFQIDEKEYNFNLSSHKKLYLVLKTHFPCIG